MKESKIHWARLGPAAIYIYIHVCVCIYDKADNSIYHPHNPKSIITTLHQWYTNLVSLKSSYGLWLSCLAYCLYCLHQQHERIHSSSYSKLIILPLTDYS